MAAFTDFDIEFTLGDDYTHPFVVETGDPPVAENVGSWQAFWLTARREIGATTPVFALSLGSGIAIEGSGATGVVLVTFARALTASLANRRHRLYADFQGRNGNGQVITLAEGTVTLKPQITTAS